MNVPVAVALPAGAKGTYRLTAEFDFGAGPKQTGAFVVRVLAKPAPLALEKRVALFDPKGLTAKLLDSLGVTYEKVDIDYEAAANSHGIPLLEAIDIVNLALGIGGDQSTSRREVRARRAGTPSGRAPTDTTSYRAGSPVM